MGKRGKEIIKLTVDDKTNTGLRTTGSELPTESSRGGNRSERSTFPTEASRGGNRSEIRLRLALDTKIMERIKNTGAENTKY